MTIGKPTNRARLAIGVLALLAVCSVGACSSTSTSDAQPANDATDELLAIDLGGDGSTSLQNQNAFSMSARNLPGDQRNRFELGDSFFTQNWVTAPATTTTRDGLGPLFNAQACAGCHVLDGRGEPFEPTPEGEVPPTDATGSTRDPGLLLRLSLPGTAEHGGPRPDPVYGNQLTDLGVLGVPAEGQVSITVTERPGRFGDGSEYSLAEPTYTIADPAYGALPADLQTSPRVAPPTIGIGLLEAIPESDLRAAADPEDSDDDGVSGRLNTVWNSTTGREEIGRFGWKANVPTAEQQTAGAFAGDIGITSPVLPVKDCTPTQNACLGALEGGSPEIDRKTFDNVVFYTRVVAVPKRRPAPEKEAEHNGAQLFASSGCAACHTPTQSTGESDIAALSNQTIHPFTDLLLHDLGAGLSDGRPDFAAGPTEWRTAPLWGIGLYDEVNGHTRYLHDGRARNLEEAILWHGGEAADAESAYRDMPKSDRADLITYLKTL